jgi:hypothetical protein
MGWTFIFRIRARLPGEFVWFAAAAVSFSNYKIDTQYKYMHSSFITNKIQLSAGSSPS